MTPTIEQLIQRGLIDIIDAEGVQVEVQVRGGGYILYVHVKGVTVLRLTTSAVNINYDVLPLGTPK